MSVFLEKGRGWKYDFVLRKKRYVNGYFKTKSEARQAEALRKEEIRNPRPMETVWTDITFYDLINRRLDHVRAYNSKTHYRDYRYMAKRWVARWGDLNTADISQPELESYFLQRRRKVRAYTVNQEIKYLKAVFNWGIKKDLIDHNPVNGIEFMPVEAKHKYIPPVADVDAVLAIAEGDMVDYLWLVRDTLARKHEINNLTWEDVNLVERYVTLYTCKKKGGHRTPRHVPMTAKVYSILERRYADRDPWKSWVFWHSYTSRITGEEVTGIYGDRKRALKTLCEKAGVNPFGLQPFVISVHHLWNRAIFPSARSSASLVMRIGRRPRSICIASAMLSVTPCLFTKRRGKSPTQSPTQKEEKGYDLCRNPLNSLVELRGLEPLTS